MFILSDDESSVEEIRAGLLNGGGYDLSHNQDGTFNKFKKSALDVLLNNAIGDVNAEITLPLIRKIFPNLLAWETVGVQPMAGPIAQIYTRRRTYDNVSPHIIDLQFLTEVAQAKIRTFSAHLTPSEIITELDNNLLQNLQNITGNPNSIFDMANLEDRHTFIGDIYTALSILIYRQANLIAARNHRGVGNWCVVSPTALRIIKFSASEAFVPVTENLSVLPTHSKFVGTLNKHMKVYLNPHASPNTPVLVGYKGSDYDASAFYCPFSIIQNNPEKIIICDEFMPLSARPHCLGTAQDYLGTVGINPDTLTFV